MREAYQRAKFRAAVSDAGFDSEANHRLARQELGVRSIIPPDALTKASIRSASVAFGASSRRGAYRNRIRGTEVRQQFRNSSL